MPKYTANNMFVCECEPTGTCQPNRPGEKFYGGSKGAVTRHENAFKRRKGVTPTGTTDHRQNHDHLYEWEHHSGNDDFQHEYQFDAHGGTTQIGDAENPRDHLFELYAELEEMLEIDEAISERPSNSEMVQRLIANFALSSNQGQGLSKRDLKMFFFSSTMPDPFRKSSGAWK